MSRKIRVGIGAAIAIAAIVGIVGLSTPTEARIICECADIDAPVKCKGGKIYYNACVAACFGATHCVPYGG